MPKKNTNSTLKKTAAVRAATRNRKKKITPLADTVITQKHTPHPELHIMLMGEYFLIAILCAIIGIALLYLVLAWL